MKQIFNPHLAPLLMETHKYNVPKEHLKYMGSYLICINFLRLESIFRKYALSKEVLEGVPLLHSWNYIKAILRCKSAAQSDRFSLFIDQPAELRDIPHGLTWRFVPASGVEYRGNYDEIVNYWLDNMTDSDIRKVYVLTDRIFHNMLTSHPNYKQFYKDSVILFDIVGDNIHMYSLGDIKAYRYAELTEGVLKLPRWNRTFDHGRPTLDLWEGVVHDG